MLAAHSTIGLVLAQQLHVCHHLVPLLDQQIGGLPLAVKLLFERRALGEQRGRRLGHGERWRGLTIARTQQSEHVQLQWWNPLPPCVVSRDAF